MAPHHLSEALISKRGWKKIKKRKDSSHNYVYFSLFFWKCWKDTATQALISKRELLTIMASSALQHVFFSLFERLKRNRWRELTYFGVSIYESSRECKIGWISIASPVAEEAWHMRSICHVSNFQIASTWCLIRKRPFWQDSGGKVGIEIFKSWITSDKRSPSGLRQNVTFEGNP